MSSSLIYKKTDYCRNNYISTLDLMNKYNLDEKKKIPILNKVVIELSIAQILKNFGKDNKNAFNSEIQIKSVLILYLLVFNVPFINFKKLEVKIKNYLKENNDSFSLRVSITDNNLINQLLIRTFFEKRGFSISDLRYFKKRDTKINVHCMNEKKFIYSTYIPSHNFVEIENFFNRVLFGVNSNELFLKLSLHISNPVIKTNFKNVIKNLPIFWING
jgi:hypothetical protein